MGRYLALPPPRTCRHAGGPCPRNPPPACGRLSVSGKPPGSSGPSTQVARIPPRYLHHAKVRGTSHNTSRKGCRHTVLQDLAAPFRGCACWVASPSVMSSMRTSARTMPGALPSLAPPTGGVSAPRSPPLLVPPTETHIPRSCFISLLSPINIRRAPEGASQAEAGMLHRHLPSPGWHWRPLPPIPCVSESASLTPTSRHGIRSVTPVMVSALPLSQPSGSLLRDGVISLGLAARRCPH